MAKIDPGTLDPRGSGGVQAGPKVSTREHAGPYGGDEYKISAVFGPYYHRSYRSEDVRLPEFFYPPPP